MKSALVTGASGLLGSYIVKRLHTDGWRVAALVRNPARCGWVEEIGGTLIQGDILDSGSLEKAMLGQDVVFHTAATIGTGDNPGSFWTGNVGGTSNLVQAAAIAGARVIHISTTSVFGRDRYYEKPTDESVPDAHAGLERPQRAAHTCNQTTTTDGHVNCVYIGQVTADL